MARLDTGDIDFPLDLTVVVCGNARRKHYSVKREKPAASHQVILRRKRKEAQQAPRLFPFTSDSPRQT